MFKRCGTTSGSGGAISVNAESGAQLTVKSTTFEDCWCVKDTASSSYSSDISSQSLTVQYGKCVYVESTTPHALLIRSHWRGTLDSRENVTASDYWVKNTDTSDECSILDYLFPLDGVKVYIGSLDNPTSRSNSEEDTKYPHGGSQSQSECGYSRTNPCPTISDALKGIPSAAQFILLSGTHDAEGEESVFDGNYIYSIAPDTEDGAFIQDVTIPVQKIDSSTSLGYSNTNGALFTVASSENEPTLNASTFILSLSTSFPIECPIFSLSTGQLLLSSLSIYPDTDKSPINLTSPLIVLRGGDMLSMEGCSISNISLTSGDFEASVLCTYLNST